MDVLIVEDEEDVSEMLGLLLEHRGHTVRRARDAARALELLRERLPEVMIVDVEMPGMSGPEMLREAWARSPPSRSVPAILVSGVMGLPAIADDLGTPYFLAKPFEIERLVALMRRARHERAPGPHRDVARSP